MKNILIIIIVLGISLNLNAPIEQTKEGNLVDS